MSCPLFGCVCVWGGDDAVCFLAEGDGPQKDAFQPKTHKIRNHPQPQGRAWTTGVEGRTPARSTSPNSCSAGLALREFIRKSAVLQGKRWHTGEKEPKIQILFFCLKVRGGSLPSK